MLPVGAVEWHGPHLPLGTDLILADGFAAETAVPAPGPRGVLFPAVRVRGLPGADPALAGDGGDPAGDRGRLPG